MRITMLRLSLAALGTLLFAASSASLAQCPGAGCPRADSQTQSAPALASMKSDKKGLECPGPGCPAKAVKKVKVSAKAAANKSAAKAEKKTD